MVSSWLLTKTRARNDADTSGLKKVKCVEDISRLTGLGCSRQGLLRELDLGKCVHGSLHGVAGDSLQTKKDFGKFHRKIFSLTGILFKVSATSFALSA